MFRQVIPPKTPRMARITLDGAPMEVPADMPLALALLCTGGFPVRNSPVHERAGQKQRAPYCMMGVCFECLVTVDGRPNQQGCLIPVRDGMVVERQQGAANLMRAANAEDGA